MTGIINKSVMRMKERDVYEALKLSLRGISCY